ncbi:IclR family transcriptional regulator C-terminal domain-containing protein [Pseudonocardia tropica]|uniref:IclR family transcriptional regulator C-terminal domain-containing protein n=1 Tax=Pseudonocardia tropica TaxID=681289 RepID=A0ABV1JZJ8_9PSEU
MVPVRDATGEVVAAMSVSVPSSRMNDDKRRDVLGVLRGCADRLPDRLGHQPAAQTVTGRR